jgi:diaminohydroxyphosphoribosylaminopyrimidine deaminase / 5-amino-6-(5-phosphoribosylamino)uracil reductase
MQRCLELAKIGAGSVAPNPMVGAVLVFADRVIGEGWHQKYGEAHAEVNCIHQAIQNGHMDLSQSTLFVSLEPCAHFGKTPPCADLIIQHKIPKVVIGCRDPFKEVNGKGIEKLQAAGVEVELADRLLAYECEQLNKRFFTFHKEKRPYIILKWAQTVNGKIAASPNPSEEGALKSAQNKNSFLYPESKAPLAGVEGLRLLISNEYSNRLVHQWRSEEAAILIGTNTALLDNPSLTNRLWSGTSPIRFVLDMNLRLPSSLKIFNREITTVIFNSIKQEEENNLSFFKIEKEKNVVKQIIAALYQLKVQSVLVEGGAMLLQSFIDDGLWDEIRIITNRELRINEGLAAPVPENGILVKSTKLFSDTIETYVRATEDY